MNFLSRRSRLALSVVTDIALYARPLPVSAKALAARHELPPRHLETVLQALVRHAILKGVRGPRGGYELARERRRITAAEIVRVAMTVEADDIPSPLPDSKLALRVIGPLVERGTAAFLAELQGVTVEDLCERALKEGAVDALPSGDFTI